MTVFIRSSRTPVRTTWMPVSARIVFERVRDAIDAILREDVAASG
jgi:hypothetical protein